MRNAYTHTHTYTYTTKNKTKTDRRKKQTHLPPETFSGASQSGCTSLLKSCTLSASESFDKSLMLL